MMARRLYFDIDGTLLVLDTGEPKPALAAGRFERAIRAAGVSELVCVGNFCTVIHQVKSVRPDYDGVGAIFSLCRGAFEHEAWFRGVTRLVTNPPLRVAEIDLEVDWWYTDDLGQDYCRRAGRMDVFRAHVGGRILCPDPIGTGEDVLAWLETMPRTRESRP